ncbi:nuclear transport factor 2 family protein [Algoriphagus lacus]|uniref:nuclear transport factor 2 family protein n=1 Tax=Algoriphagus lacus TaxID=2056311 RepID=UPI001F45CE4F|nr:nuclear transport factor 2 family protein [Algoriphagus lacus]
MVQKLSKQLESELIQAYNSFWVSNLSGDMESFASSLADDFSIFGSANGEIFFSKQEAVAYFSATADQLRDKIQMRDRDISVQSLDDNSVVVREICDVYVLIGDNWTYYGRARISCIVKMIDSKWKVLHHHASFPDHRTEEGQQLAAEKIEKENLELREAVRRRTAELELKNRELEAARKNAENALTELQATQKQLINAEKMASLGELTAGIAHEIQNPLNFVNNFSEVNSELIDEQLEEIEKGDLEEVKELAHLLKENSSKIALHGKRADAIVKGMLEHSKRGSGQKEPTDLNALADDFLRMTYQSFVAKDPNFKVELQTNLDPDLPRISVIPQDIGKVLLNLYNNAF